MSNLGPELKYMCVAAIVRCNPKPKPTRCALLALRVAQRTRDGVRWALRNALHIVVRCCALLCVANTHNEHRALRNASNAQRAGFRFGFLRRTIAHKYIWVLDPNSTWAQMWLGCCSQALSQRDPPDLRSRLEGDIFWRFCPAHFRAAAVGRRLSERDDRPTGTAKTAVGNSRAAGTRTATAVFICDACFFSLAWRAYWQPWNRLGLLWRCGSLQCSQPARPFLICKFATHTRVRNGWGRGHAHPSMAIGGFVRPWSTPVWIAACLTCFSRFFRTCGMSPEQHAHAAGIAIVSGITPWRSERSSLELLAVTMRWLSKLTNGSSLLTAVIVTPSGVISVDCDNKPTETDRNRPNDNRGMRKYAGSFGHSCHRRRRRGDRRERDAPTLPALGRCSTSAAAACLLVPWQSARDARPPSCRHRTAVQHHAQAVPGIQRCRRGDGQTYLCEQQNCNKPRQGLRGIGSATLMARMGVSTPG